MLCSHLDGPTLPALVEFFHTALAANLSLGRNKIYCRRALLSSGLGKKKKKYLERLKHELSHHLFFFLITLKDDSVTAGVFEHCLA